MSEIMRVHKITNQFQLELHADPKIDRRNGMRKQIGTVPLISTGQSIIYAYCNRNKGVNLAMANWLNEITKRFLAVFRTHHKRNGIRDKLIWFNYWFNCIE